MKEFLLRKFCGEQLPTLLNVGSFTSTLDDVDETLIMSNTLHGFFRVYINCLDGSGNRRKGRRSRAKRVFKSSIERNKYKDFTFKFLSKLHMQNCQINLSDFYILDIRYGKKMLCLCM